VTHYKVSQRYGRALFEVARDSDSMEQTAADLKLIETVLLEAPQTLLFFTNLVAREDEVRQVLESGFKPFVSEQTWRFLELLLDRKRLGVLEWVPRMFQRYYDEHFGILETRVEGVYQLSEEEKEAIAIRLEKMTKKKIRIDFSLNKNLIGGFKLFLGEKLIDSSIANQLQRIRKTMLTT
jgi:F-type H+-transporting ATPase subunit delta